MPIGSSTDVSSPRVPAVRMAGAIVGATLAWLSSTGPLLAAPSDPPADVKQEADARYKQLQNDVNLRKQSNEAEIRILELTAERHQRHHDRHVVDVSRFTIHAPISGLAVMSTIWREGEMGQVRQGDQVRPQGDRRASRALWDADVHAEHLLSGARAHLLPGDDR